MGGTGPTANLTPDDVRSVKEFGAALTALRLSRGLSVRAVARLSAGIPASTLGGYFSGRHLPPPTRPEVLTAVLRAVGVAHADHPVWHAAAQRLHIGRLPRGATPVPYLGLATYGVQDSELFFGREDLITQILAMVRKAAGAPGPIAPPIVMVLGPSGSGKSSVIRAGVIPTLATWAYAVVSPGNEPLRALSDGLAGLGPDPTADGEALSRELRASEGEPDPEYALLVLDQLEELWTLATPEEADDFLQEVAAWSVAAPHRVVLCSLRADFFASATESPVLLHALRTRQVVVGPMSQDDLRRIMTAPAEVAGVELAPALVEHMLADADPDGPHGAVAVLPHLSHALLLMWLTGDRRRLTGDDYARVGGVRGAVTRSADEAYTSLPVELHALARRVLLRLVVVENDTMATGAVVPVPNLLALGDPSEVRRIVDHFVAGRILTVSEEGCRFSHEAVIDRWDLLRGWIASDRTRLTITHLVDREADAWEVSDADQGLLLRGSRLRTALDWAGEDPPPPDSRAARYLAASEQEEARVSTEQDRAHRRVRRWLAVTVVLALVTTLATALSVRARRDANERNTESISRQLAVASSSLAMTNPSLGHQLAVAAYAKAGTSDAIGAVLDASSTVQATRYTPGAGQRTLASDLGHTLVAITGPQAKVFIHRATDLARPVATVEAPTNGKDDSLVFAAAFSPDGRTLAVGGMSASVRLYDLTDPARPRTLGEVKAATSGTIYALAWSSDGTIVAAGTEKAGVQRWRVGASTTLLTPIPVEGGVKALAVVPRSGELVVGDSASGDVSLWRGAETPVFVGRVKAGAPVVSLAARPDGAFIAAGTQTGTVVTLPLAAGRWGAPTILPAGVTWINALAWSDDGQRLHAASSDLTVRSWNAEGTPGKVLTLPGLVTALVFADPTRLVAGLSTGEVVTWSTRGPELFADATNAFSTDWIRGGRQLVVFAGRPVRAAVVYDAADPTSPKELGRTPPVPEKCGNPNGTGGASSDGALVVLGTGGGCVVGYDLRDPTVPVTRFVLQPSAQAGPQQIRVSSDGSGFLAGGDDRIVRWWSVPAAGEPTLTVLDGPTNGVPGVELSADGRLAIAASLDHRVYIWQVRAGAAGKIATGPVTATRIAPLATIERPDAAVTVALDKDSGRLAVAGSEPSVAIYDISTPERPRSVTTIAGLTAPAYGVGFDKDGVLGAALSNGRVVLWRPDGEAYRTWTVLRAGTAAPSLLSTLAWHPDGKHLVGVGTAGMSRIWILDPAMATAFVCRNVGAPITAGEWRASVTDVPFAATCPQRN